MPPEDNKPEPKVIYAFGARREDGAAAPSADSSVAGPAAPVDDDAIEQLEALLKKFKAGELRGLAVVAGIWAPERGYSDCYTALSITTTEQPYHFMGGLELVKHDVTSFLTEMLDDDMD